MASLQYLISSSLSCSPFLCCRWWVRLINLRPTLTLTWSRTTGRWPQPAARPAASEVWERPSGWTSSTQMCFLIAGSFAATWRPLAPPPADPVSKQEIYDRSWAAGPSRPRRRAQPRPLPLPRSTPRWMAGCRSPMGPALSLQIPPARRPAAPRTATRHPVPLAQENECASVTKFCTTRCAVTMTRRRSKTIHRRTRVAVLHQRAILSPVSWQARSPPNVLPLSTRSSITVWTLRTSPRRWGGWQELTHYPGKVS